MFARVETNVDKEMKLEDLEVTAMKQNLSSLQTLRSFHALFRNASCLIILLSGKNPEIQQVASFLHSLFHSVSFLEDPVPILLAVNKSDQKDCKSHEYVYYAVQKEVGLMESDILDYEFRHYSPCTIDSCNCSVVANSIATVNEFINASVN